MLMPVIIILVSIINNRDKNYNRISNYIIILIWDNNKIITSMILIIEIKIKIIQL